ncbi:hypothetical protein [Rivibacter subsaxonicus]|nr:hypothetical protein [Rivibacter subsaxonicus]
MNDERLAAPSHERACGTNELFVVHATPRSGERSSFIEEQA